ncbi:hypothetical protein COTS27_01069 [Spirochaetota bacterium]|nr:hypothetical protein COTS27_01069 [Spirochaetota bacterium]
MQVMKKLSYINVPEINQEHIRYLETGIFNIIRTNNCASLDSFRSDLLNSQGIFLDKETLRSIFEEMFEASFNFSLIPEQFIITIRKSPIALFKRWIFNISDKPLLSILHRSSGTERDFFPLILKKQLNITPITSNIAHERFLISVYSRKKLEEYKIALSTQLIEGKKLVIYKDYAKKKISTLTLKKPLLPNKVYPISIVVKREPSKIKFHVTIANKHAADHVIKFKRSSVSSAHERKLLESNKFYDENRKKVINIIKGFDNQTVKTNNYANISLGRVAKIPILITLPERTKNANTEVKILFSEKQKIIKVRNKNNEILKTVTICNPPKSNWLCRSRVAY